MAEKSLRNLTRKALVFGSDSLAFWVGFLSFFIRFPLSCGFLALDDKIVSWDMALVIGRDETFASRV